MSQSLSNRSVAVVVTTYNNPRSLELCLLSLADQSHRSFDVFVADDGSGDETRDLLLRLKREVPYQLYHIWHPDRGYRKAKINNTVFGQILPGKYPVTICVDHDVIVHRNFIEDHWMAHKNSGFSPLLFMGRRVELGPEITKEITPSTLPKFTQGLSLRLVRAGLQGDAERWLRSIRVQGPDWWLKLLRRKRVPDLLGSNFSISTQALHDVNGYSEDFTSYWGEDGDLFVRVRNRGIAIDGRVGYAIQWHLYHKRLEETEEHKLLYQRLLKTSDYVRCKNGIVKD